MTPEQKQEIASLMKEHGIEWTSLPPNTSYQTYMEAIKMIIDTQEKLSDEVLEKARNAPIDEGYML